MFKYLLGIFAICFSCFVSVTLVSKDGFIAENKRLVAEKRFRAQIKQDVDKPVLSKLRTPTP